MDPNVVQQGAQGARQGIQQGAAGAQGAAQGMGGATNGMLGGPPPGMRGGPGALGFIPGGPWASLVLVALLGITLVVLAIVFWRLLGRAGMTPALGLLMLVPLVNLGVALWFAFAEWPAEKEAARLRAIAASVNPEAVGLTQASAAPPASGVAPVASA
jgi:hypothetical protein